MEKEIQELISLSYKGRFSLYHKTDDCLVRIYFKDGSQHKENGKTIIEALNKIITFLKNHGK